MSGIENDLKSELKTTLIQGDWTVKQFHSIENSDELELKLLFENLPGILIWDFFSPNLINEFTPDKTDLNKFKLISIGLDDVIWTYQLLKIS
jgi:hypothetical protein